MDVKQITVFQMNTTLSYFMVQGANDSTQNTRVTSFKIAYSHDGVTFWDLKVNGVVKVGIRLTLLVYTKESMRV